MQDFYEDAGRSALGSRLRRLTDRITDDSARLYELYDVALEPRWFPVFFTLLKTPGLSTTEIADIIGQSRPSVSQVLTDMRRHDLVETQKSETDARATVSRLTPKGKALAAPLSLQLEDVQAVMEDIASETERDLWRALDDIEKALNRASIYERVVARRASRGPSAVSIRPFRPEDALAFKSLNVEWIAKHFTVEAEDLKTLDDPQGAVIDRGGRIFMAFLGDAPVGTSALIVKDNETVELAKMAVTPHVQGKGLGKQLALAALDEARAMGVKRVFLETNSKLTAALSLYRRLGFTPVETGESPYARCDAQMELLLD